MFVAPNFTICAVGRARQPSYARDGTKEFLSDSSVSIADKVTGRRFFCALLLLNPKLVSMNSTYADSKRFTAESAEYAEFFQTILECPVTMLFNEDL